MQPHRNDHQVSGPAVHVAQQLAKRNVIFQIQNVSEGLHFRRVVIKHQEHAGKSEDDKQVERNSTHTPSKIVLRRVGINFRRMQVKEDVGKDAESAVAPFVVVLDPENRTVKLSLLRLFQLSGL